MRKVRKIRFITPTFELLKGMRTILKMFLPTFLLLLSSGVMAFPKGVSERRTSVSTPRTVSNDSQSMSSSAMSPSKISSTTSKSNFGYSLGDADADNSAMLRSGKMKGERKAMKSETQAQGACGARFLKTAMSENATQRCVDLVGFNLDNFPPKESDLIKINYWDKCFSKCYLTELNYMTASDSFDISKISEEVRRETPPDKQEARIAAITKCVKKTDEMATEEGGVVNSPCKYALVFFACARAEEKRMIC